MVDDDNDNDDDNDINRQDGINNYDDMISAHLKQLPLPIRNVVFQVNIFSKRFYIELKQNIASQFASILN